MEFVELKYSWIYSLIKVDNSEFAKSRFQHVEMENMHKITDTAEFLVTVVCIEPNLQNFFKFGKTIDNTECHIFFAKNEQFPKKKKTDCLKK